MADKMVRCPEGHFYDPTKHQACPWCALPPDAASGQQKTRPVGMDNPPPLPSGPKPGATRRVGMDAATGSKLEPVVGWLVCLEGPDRGRDFRLHAEKNFMGRSQAMDVCIPNDDTVSREKHGVVIFDPKKQVFWVLPGDASGLVYLNGEIIHSPTQFNRDDVLEVGQTKLVLVPFCGEKYSWTSEFTATVQRLPE